MRVAIIAGCEIKVNWLFVAVLLVAALSGYLTVFLLSFALVLLHEGCHALAARACGFATREIELLPFGGVARIEGLFELHPASEAIIAAAGPACNLLLLMAALSIDALFPLPPSRLRLFVDVNLGIAALNLLPALPLDGGRILRGLLGGHFDTIRVTRGCAAAGIAASALLAGLFLWLAMKGTMNISLMLMALFLCLSAWREYAQAPYLLYRGFAGKRQSLERDRALPVRALVVRWDVRLGELVRRFSPGRYHMITVLDENLQLLGTVDEERIVAALMDGGSDVEVSRLLRPTITDKMRRL